MYECQLAMSEKTITGIIFVRRNGNERAYWHVGVAGRQQTLRRDCGSCGGNVEAAGVVEVVVVVVIICSAFSRAAIRFPFAAAILLLPPPGRSARGKPASGRT